MKFKLIFAGLTIAGFILILFFQSEGVRCINCSRFGV